MLLRESRQRSMQISQNEHIKLVNVLWQLKCANIALNVDIAVKKIQIFKKRVDNLPENSYNSEDVL